MDSAFLWQTVFQPVEQEEVQTPTVGEYKEEEIPDIVDTEMSAEADGAEVQNPEVHNAVTAEDTDDAGNAGAKERILQLQMMPLR